jgi:resuscitation-promoting factor RpfA
VGRHSKPTKTKIVLRRTGVLAALAGATVGGIVGTGAGTANAFPGQSGLVMCESSGNPTAVNNTPAGQRAGRPAGLFQIVTRTWLANGGGQFAPTADLASPAQQQIVADRIFAQQGSAPWQCHPGSGPAAFSNFGGAGSATHVAAPQVAAPQSATPSAPAAMSHQSHQSHASSNPQGEYTVVAGDTLSGIARKFNVPGGYRELQRLNAPHIPDANLIFVGQKIAIR